MRLAWAVLLLAGCTLADEDVDVVGPFTGTPTYYVVDGITLPQNSEGARLLGDDLNGDKTKDNQLGSVIATLSGQDAVNRFGADIIAAGAIRSRIEIVADDLAGDDSVGVSYLGVDGAIATPFGGRLRDGVFASNLTRSSDHLGTAVVRLPVFQDADPATIEVIAAQLTLEPDGAGGFHGHLHGVLLPEEVHAATIGGITQLLENNPRGHLTMWEVFDTNRDGLITSEEMLSNTLFMSLLAPDLRVELDGRTTDVLSLGFAFHVSPCASATDCPIAAPVNTCFDRVLDGDETGLDCGGSCGACIGGEVCAQSEDCQSQTCSANVCEAASCSDGALTRFETDVDCGPGCARCARGLLCSSNADCLSGVCNTFGRCS